MRPSDEHQTHFNQPDLMAEASAVAADDDNILAALECEDWHTPRPQARRRWPRALGGACALAGLGLLAWYGASLCASAPETQVIPFAVLADQTGKAVAPPVAEAVVASSVPVALTAPVALKPDLAPLATPLPERPRTAMLAARADTRARVAARAPARARAVPVASPGDSDVVLISALISHANSAPPMAYASARRDAPVNTCAHRGTLARACRNRAGRSPSI